jgi:iron complex transport system substrate-binding protein
MLRIMLLALVGALCPAASALAEPVSVVDVLGRTVSLPAPAKRIVLAQGRQLGALGFVHADPVSVLAGWGSDYKRQSADAYARYRAKFPAIDAIPTVGDGGVSGGFSLEAAVALAPDLVVLSKSLAGTRSGPGDLVERFAAAGIPVVVVDFYFDPLADTVPSLRALGGLLGQSVRTEAFIRFYQARLARVAERIRGAARPRVFMHSHAGGFDCCTSPGRGTLDAFIRAAGGENVAAPFVPGETGQVSLEKLLTLEPDIYIATGGTHLARTGGLVLGLGVDRATAAESFRRLLAHPGLAALKAVRTGQAFGLWHLFNDTPAHAVAIERLASWLHPERFRDIDPDETLAEASRLSAIPLDGTLWIRTAP